MKIAGNILVLRTTLVLLHKFVFLPHPAQSISWKAVEVIGATTTVLSEYYPDFKKMSALYTNYISSGGVDEG